MKLIEKIFGTHSGRELKRIEPLVDKIESLRPEESQIVTNLAQMRRMLSEVDSPNLQFRFCSKCDGNYEYCEEHLYTHTHVKRG